MHTFFHTSLFRNKNSILKKGLIPKIGERSKLIGEEIPAVYLFNRLEDLDNALLNWLGDAFEDYADEHNLDELVLATFEVTIPINFLGLNFQNTSEHYESICTSIIPAEYISFLRED